MADSPPTLNSSLGTLAPLNRAGCTALVEGLLADAQRADAASTIASERLAALLDHIRTRMTQANRSLRNNEAFLERLLADARRAGTIDSDMIAMHGDIHSMRELLGEVRDKWSECLAKDADVLAASEVLLEAITDLGNPTLTDKAHALLGIVSTGAGYVPSILVRGAGSLTKLILSIEVMARRKHTLAESLLLAKVLITARWYLDDLYFGGGNRLVALIEKRWLEWPATNDLLAQFVDQQRYFSARLPLLRARAVLR